MYGTNLDAPRYEGRQVSKDYRRTQGRVGVWVRDPIAPELYTERIFVVDVDRVD